MTYKQRINRQRRIREIINKTLSCGIIALLIFCLLWLTIGIHEVETYSFHAEITDKAVTDKYRSNTKYHIFWCNGEEADSEQVDSNTYARYSIGDLIEIEAVVEQDWFGNKFVTYDVIGN